MFMLSSYAIPPLLIILNTSYAFRCLNSTTNNTRLNRLFVDRKEVYRLRRQSEIMKYRITQTEEHIGKIGITGVRLSPDCSHAKISVHIDGDHDSVQRSLGWLGRHSKLLRFQLGSILNYRKRVPEIQFVHEKTDVFSLFDIEKMIKEAVDAEINNVSSDSGKTQYPINDGSDVDSTEITNKSDENEQENKKFDYSDDEIVENEASNDFNEDKLQEILSEFDDDELKSIMDSLKDLI